MQAALENFKQLEAPHKIVILGDMFELGNESETEHQKIAALATSTHFSAVYLIGKAFAATKTKNAFLFDNFKDFKKSKFTVNYNKANILIKGSRGMALERVLDLF